MNVAPNLITVSTDITAGQVGVLEFNDRRTFLRIGAVASNQNTELRLWIGPIPPPADVTQWVRAPAGPANFERGCTGPVYMTAVGNQFIELSLLSAIEEQVQVVPLVDVCLRDNITFDGNQLVSPEGDNIVFCR